MNQISRASEKLIPPLAILGLIIGSWSAVGWGAGVGIAGAAFIMWRGWRYDARRAEFERRQALREAAWRMGDRR